MANGSVLLKLQPSYIYNIYAGLVGMILQYLPRNMESWAMTVLEIANGNVPLKLQLIYI